MAQDDDDLIGWVKAIAPFIQQRIAETYAAVRRCTKTDGEASSDPSDAQDEPIGA